QGLVRHNAQLITCVGVSSAAPGNLLRAFRIVIRVNQTNLCNSSNRVSMCPNLHLTVELLDASIFSLACNTRKHGVRTSPAKLAACNLGDIKLSNTANDHGVGFGPHFEHKTWFTIGSG